MPPTKRTIKRTMTRRRYTVFFLPDTEAGGYTAHIPALGIVTEGQDLTEAREMARDAIEGRLAALQELGLPLPRDVRPEYVEV